MLSNILSFWDKHFWSFLQYYKYGFLPKGEIFSVFYKIHLEQAIALFKLFYYAKDYETFYTTAVWARQYFNEGLFLYSYTVALAHRPDTYEIVLPPIYEMYPYYFFNTEVIQQAYIYKQQYGGQSALVGGYTINSNYSGYYLNLHPEQSLSYYLEDIGINSYYYYYNIYFPFWLSSEEFGFKYFNRGEEYYFYYQQLLARFYLERISNGFGEIPFINWNVPIETPYYPSLEYPNGLEFPSRPPFANLHEYFYNYGQSWSFKTPYGYSYTYIQDYERRIHDVIDSGYIYGSGQSVSIYTKEGFNMLGNLIESNYDSPNYKYYGAIWLFASHLLGYSYQPLDTYMVVPSALEHFETALRDPVFYQLYKKIILYFQRYYSYVPAYTTTELIFPGVKVVDFKVDSLFTYYDYFYTDLGNAVYYSPEELLQNKFQVRVSQYRLNHKPFTYKFVVHSEIDTKAVVKIFLGPKYDEYGRYINMTENRMNMVVLDYFVYDLKTGENVITKNSYDSYYYAPDATSYYDIYKLVMSGGDFSQAYHYGKQNYYYFPQRYMLPKGSSSGTPYQFYVVVYPYVPKQVVPAETYQTYFYPYVGDQVFYDSYSLGYPFDKFIYYEQLFFQVPNFYSHDVMIYFKDDINVV
ncbi:hypothetical protein NQ314_000412 [Rhamnusium bicolor]|uniref:Uncharacterized protein n=1 Tax=Rhamnusium bicolor TaxID=1586634 RepID=A0AAV8ZYB0_9CUCU|nr:hypothetical protein NQ314_000412 [Rhamnusium bicolor]